jgi:FixJ family two-component response regulator
VHTRIGWKDLLLQDEREVLLLVVVGHTTPQSALNLGIAEITQQVLRSQIEQTRRTAGPELVRIAGKLRLLYPRPPRPIPTAPSP